MATVSLPAIQAGPRDIQRVESPALTLGGVSSIQTTIDQLKAIRTFVKQELVEHVDFGVIPGTGNKNVLLQPGAQKVAMFYNTYPEFERQVTELGEGHMEAVITTRLVSRTSREVVAMGMGSCSTMESKYRWRNGSRSCPVCGKEGTIIRGKEEYGGGWVCFDKKGGCKTKFRSEDPQITGQVVGRVENPDIYDQRNTVLKMAMKRSMVSAAISLGCMSELFTQDLDDVYDLAAHAVHADQHAAPAAPAPPPQAHRDVPPEPPGHDEHPSRMPSQARPSRTEDRPAQQAERPHGNGGPPRNGRALFAWSKEQEQKTGMPIVKWVNAIIKTHDLPARMVDLDENQVAGVHAAVAQKIDDELAKNEAGSRG